MATLTIGALDSSAIRFRTPGGDRIKLTLIIVGVLTALVTSFALESQPPTPSSAFSNAVRHANVVAPQTGLKLLRIASWNIDRGQHLDTIASELDRKQPDLCLLQEVDWNTARAGNVDESAELAQRLHLNASYGIEFEELSQEHGQQAFIGQATLTRLPLRNARVLRFERQSGFWKPHDWIPSSVPLMQRRLGDRIALVTELEFSDRLLVVYNLHLESRSMGRIQAAQLDEILADLRQYPPTTAAIIGGDLNSKYLPSFFLHKLERNGFHSAIGERIERTHVIAMALDWIFARGPVKIEEGQVDKAARGSDHYPLYATLRAE